MKEGVKKSISLILVLTLLVQLLPMVAFGVGDETNDLDISTDSETVSMKDDDAQIVGEEDALREESVKHFRLQDGGYMLVEYETAVHNQTADGAWEEIDNTLQKTGQQYVAQAGDMTRKFAASLDSGFLFETAYQGQSVSMSLARRSSRDVVAAAPDVPAAEDVLFEMLPHSISSEAVSSPVRIRSSVTCFHPSAVDFRRMAPVEAYSLSSYAMILFSPFRSMVRAPVSAPIILSTLPPRAMQFCPFRYASIRCSVAVS